MAVLVLARNKRPLMPCSEKRARKLLTAGRAVVHRVTPFVIRLKDRSTGTLQSVEVKVAPGAKTTGIALVRRHDGARLAVLNLLQLVHRGPQIVKKLQRRSAYRGRRRSRNLRYRAPRFDNRLRPKGWLPPSLQHRVDTTLSWIKRLTSWAPIEALGLERVKFDLQRLENPEISGVEYQQGTLMGYEAREYLLKKFGRQCQYCGNDEVPLEIDHIVPKARGGTDRVTNLTLACRLCNADKNDRDVREFLADQPKRLQRLLKQLKGPLKDAAAVNSTRNAIFGALRATGLPVVTGSGGQTKFNRARLGIPRSRVLDAVCVGSVAAVTAWHCPILMVSATGRGSYKRTLVDRHGFPRGYLLRAKRVHGFGTGDRVEAIVPQGKKAGRYVGRVAIRASGSFNIDTNGEVVQGITWKRCRLIQRADGYGYAPQPKAEPQDERNESSLPRASADIHSSLGLPSLNMIHCLAAFALLLVITPAVAVPPDEVRLARYTTAPAAPEPTVVDPLAVVATVHFPRHDVRTVGDAIAYLLLRTGYRLASTDAAASALLALPLPESHRVLGPYPARTILEVLVGEPFQVTASPVQRTLDICLAVPNPAPSVAAHGPREVAAEPLALEPLK